MDRLLTIGEVAEMTRLSENTLRWFRHAGGGPKSAKLGKRIFYKEQEVVAWVDAQFSSDHTSGRHSGDEVAS